MKHLFLTLSQTLVAAMLARAATLDELMEKVPAAAISRGGISPDGVALATEFLRHGAAAADRLIPILSSNRKDVRELAGYCLCGLPKGSLLPRHFEPLATACRKDRGWLPGAIAAIGGEKRVRFPLPAPIQLTKK